MRRLIPLTILAAVLVSGGVQAQETLQVTVTWYLPTGRPMANGQMPYHGAAACSSNWELGTRLRLPDGLEVVCADRGALGTTGWVDLFAPTAVIGRAFAQQYGSRTSVEVLR